MAKEYLSAQEIFKRCFDNKSNKLKTVSAPYSLQDYLNAVYDDTNDALRISGGGTGGAGYWGEPVSSAAFLPTNVNVGVIVPVISATGTITFYQRIDSGWELLSPLSDSGKTFIQWGVDNQTDLQFLVENKDRLGGVIGNSGFMIKEDVVTLNLSNGEYVVLDIQGKEQVIDDLDDGDGSEDTYYRIKIEGYVISIETFANNDAPVADKYITKMIYDNSMGGNGQTSIYLSLDEYNYYANLTPPKNVMEIYYLYSETATDIIYVQELAISDNSFVPIIIDAGQQVAEAGEGDTPTHYRKTISGYVLSIETYLTDNDVIPNRNYAKTHYDRNDGLYGKTYIYFSKDEYDLVNGLTPPKNTVYIYHIKTVNKTASVGASGGVAVMAVNDMPEPTEEMLNRVYLCMRDIYDEGDNLIYSKKSLYVCVLVEEDFIWQSL